MKEAGIKTRFTLLVLFLMFFAGPALSAREPVQYQGVKPPTNGDTEAALPSHRTGEKCCDRQVNAQRDRSPHVPSPQEAYNLVNRTLTPRRAAPRPADESQKGSR